MKKTFGRKVEDSYPWVLATFFTLMVVIQSFYNEIEVPRTAFSAFACAFAILAGALSILIMFLTRMAHSDFKRYTAAGLTGRVHEFLTEAVTLSITTTNTSVLLGLRPDDTWIVSGDILFLLWLWSMCAATLSVIRSTRGLFLLTRARIGNPN